MQLKAVNRFRQAVEEKPMQAGRKLCSELSRRVIERTPVDKGEARGGWNAALNTIDQSAEGALDPTGLEVIAQAEVVITQMRTGDEFSLANSVDHIGKLEYGASQQAPAGMLSVTIAEAPFLWREIIQGQR
jgi:hypothetical protein